MYGVTELLKKHREIGKNNLLKLNVEKEAVNSNMRSECHLRRFVKVSLFSPRNKTQKYQVLLISFLLSREDFTKERIVGLKNM